ncbi:MAG: asparagine synthase B [Lachnospiraceae bacterium]|nr:asparagine synthase B [Lachnospiraceae bacterium]
MCSIMGYRGSLISRERFKECFDRTISRGPDMQRINRYDGDVILGFERLAIMGLHEEGMQPFELNGRAVVCNGEIYGFRPIKKELEKEYDFVSDSDCEVLLPLYEKYGLGMFAKLDAEYACIIYDPDREGLVAARDPIGIRPLFYGYCTDGSMVFASEAKNLIGLVDKVMPFPPGYYWADGKFTCYRDMTKVEGGYIKALNCAPQADEKAANSTSSGMKEVISESAGKDAHPELAEICRNIREKLIAGIKKRLDADAPLGFLLSGGLDSSLVCAISAKILNKPIRTFAIGMSTDAIDLKYAKEVADYIGSDHTEVIITSEDVVDALPEVIAMLGTYDITTIRASIGMYLVCKYIHENTDIRVLMTGEISDELFGYKYTDFAPDAESFQQEAAKRIRELYMYDVLRADRCISVNSIEARVPFGDLDFVQYVMAIDPALKMNTYGKGKYLLRHSFEGDYLPYDILMREKAAFSDAVGHSMVDYLKAVAEEKHSDEDVAKAGEKYAFATPFTKESLMYREIFEKYYPGQAEMVADFWMPNKEWEGCNVNDPSARVLANYGASGV